eukprot:m51a1_g3677 hypothetical protein (322) ;mRNA; r:304044-305500
MGAVDVWPPVVGVVCLVAYFLVGAVCATSLVATFAARVRPKSHPVKLSVTYHALLLWLAICRVVLFLLRDQPDKNAYSALRSSDFAIDRACTLLCIGAATLILFHWVEKLYAMQVESDDFLPRFRWLWVLTLVVVAILLLTSTFIFLLRTAASPEAGGFMVACYTESAMSAMVSLMFSVFGSRLAVRERSAAPYEQSSRSELVKTCVATVAFSLCFALRSAGLLARVLCGPETSAALYAVLVYIAPDVLPSIVQVFILHSSKEEHAESEEYIRGLYESEDALQRQREGSVPDYRQIAAQIPSPHSERVRLLGNSSIKYINS